MKSLVLLILMYWLPCLAQGAVYQWTDENAHVHFGNVPPEPQDEYTLGDAIKPAQPSPKQVSEEMQTPQPVAPVSPAVPVVEEMPIQLPPVHKANKEELEALIIRLRQDAGEIASPANTEKSTGINAKKPATVPAEKPVLPVVKKAEQKTGEPVSAEAPSPTADQKSETRRDETLELNKDLAKTEKDADKCGFYMGFVEQYRVKKDEGCPGPHCNVYKSQLRKYRLKQERYC